MPNFSRLSPALLAAVAVACAKPAATPQDSTVTATANGTVDSTATATTPATPTDDQGGWKNLTTLAAWRGYKTQEVPKGWRLVGDTITKNVGTEDLVSKDQYENFELQLDWRLSKGGNAGVFYHATEEGDKVYWTGPEYQLLDDANHPDGKNPLTSAGSAYGLYAPPRGVVKPAGEWNSTRIVIRGPHVEHYLNGQKVVEYELWSPDWEAKVKASKFNEWKGYGRAHRGYIGIQGDHTGELSLRNLRIRELK